jgi:hypothetical protein
MDELIRDTDRWMQEIWVDVEVALMIGTASFPSDVQMAGALADNAADWLCGQGARHLEQSDGIIAAALTRRGFSRQVIAEVLHSWE